ncbi:MAG TPA: HYR domain-containing protein [Saprospiraceae bacterium]|nr:HYR domain-containing protein [Saprospiraceae bacterium]
MKKNVLLFIGLILFAFESLQAQACNATAGLLNLSNSTFCVGDTVRPTLVNATTNPTYTNELIVVDDNGLIVKFGITNGEIVDLPLGQYGVHAFNYRNSNPPQQGPQLGQRITDIADPEINCYDISALEPFVITDTVAPTAVCSDQQVLLYLDEDGEVSVAPSDFDFGSFDEGCVGIDTLFLEQEIFTCLTIGEMELKLYVQDSVGNLDSCVTQISVLDTFPPQVTCLDTTVLLSPLGIGELSISEVLDDVDDACDEAPSLQLSQEEFTCEDLGTQLVYLIAEDQYGNRDSCTARVTVRDTTPPIVRCQPGIAYLNASGKIIPDPSQLDDGSADLCGGFLEFRLVPDHFDCNTLGSKPITLFAKDQYGNEGSCETSISVLDTVAPNAQCLSQTIFLDDSGTAMLSAAEVDNSSDNCSIEQRNLEKNSFSCIDIGNQRVLLTVEDFSGNQDTCYARVEVRDTISPLAICQAATIYLNEAGMAPLSTAEVNDGSMDNCGVLSNISLSQNQFTCEDLGTKTVALSLSDPYGNSDRCTAMVTIRDTLAPIPQCQAVSIYLDKNGQAQLDHTLVDDGSSDNCVGVLEYTLSRMFFTCEDIGESSVILKVTDGQNNLDSCVAIITVIDTIPPEPSCENVTIYTGENGLAVLSVNAIDAGSMDICTSVEKRYLSEDRFTCGELGENTVQLYLEDQFGNLDSCSATITVKDTLPPILRCEDQTIYLDQSGQAGLLVSDVDAGSTDNCGGIASRSLSQSDFSCTEVGLNTVILKVEDSNGNVDSCAVQITVLDTVAPTAQCKDFTLALGTDGAALLTPDLINQQSTDNCRVTGFELSKSNFLCSDLGANTVVMTVRDQNNNRGTCQSIVTVVDRNKPEVFTQNIEVYLDENGRIRVSPLAIDTGSTDNCSIDSLWLSQRDFDCSHIGPNLIRLFVRDIDGNINDKAAVVEIKDNRNPVLSCPENVVLTTDLDGAGNCSVVILDDQLDPTRINDNCGIDTFYHDFTAATANQTLLGATFATGNTAVTWTVVDNNGQLATCDFEVRVEDNEAPFARCKDSVLVQLNEGGFAVLDSSLVDNGSSDNCGIERYELDINEVDCNSVGYNLIRVIMQDAAGNQNNCEVVVGVVASEACNTPVFANSGGPDIADPCTCRADGAFDEQVVIGPTTNDQVWTVKSTNLLNPITLIPYPVGTPFTEVPINTDSSIYTLQGVHLDGVGYSITAESPVFADLSISNICYYPQPEILGLDGSICLFTNSIPLEASIMNNVQGTGYFTINGEIATEVRPMELGVGSHEVVYHFDAGDPASLNEPSNMGCMVEVAKTIEIIETNRFFACNDLVNITSNVSCEILVKPQMILSGDYLCYDDYQVFLAFDGEAVPNPVPSEYAGETLEALVQHKVSGRICYGNISIKDVSGPQITECPGDIIDRFICTDLDSIFNNPASLDSTSKFYTGIPIVEDNCTGTIINFQDNLISGAACLDPAVQTIRRVFRVADQFGNTTTCEQRITFNRPTEIFFPEDTIVRINCDAPDLATNQEGHLAPSVTGAPYVINGFGEAINLVDYRICGYLLLYEDLKSVICPAKESLLRTWRLFDECAGAISMTKTQYIQYGDFDPPVLSCPAVDLDRNGKIDPLPIYSTSPFNCLADLSIPMPEVDECSDYTVETRVFTWQTEDRFGFPLRDSIFTELPNADYVDGQVKGVPVGDHYFVYTVRDVCNNVARDTCQFRVVDGIAPVALCEDDLVVSLSNDGTQVFPIDIDAGSRDNCDGTNLGLEIRRLVSAECSETDSTYYSDWAQAAELTCCDVGKLVTVELRTSDQSGNQNRCVSRVRVKDNLRPSCQAPFSVSVDCDELPTSFDPSKIQLLQNSFGTPVIEDNCEASWIELAPQVDLDQCGIGSIIRSFEVKDKSGNMAAGICQQVITVDAVYDYTIKFPADTRNSCGEINRDTVEVFENACDMLAINVMDSEFQRSPEGCFKIERTYRIINWCEYDGFSNPIIVPRNLTCEGIPGDQDVWVHVSRNDTTYYDQNDDPLDMLPPIDSTGEECNGRTNPEGHWTNSGLDNSIRSSGYWQYTQYISIVDDVDPIISFSPLSEVCSNNDACTADLTFPFTVSENCTSDDLSLSVIVDLGDDGLNDYILLAEEIEGTYPNYNVSGNFDLGRHRFYLRVIDGCNNEATAELPFTVVDCKAPSPLCQDGLVVELSRLEEPADINNDGIEDLASAYAPAIALLASTTTDCSGPVRYSINRVGQSPSVDQDSLQVTCADEGIVLVEVHAWDSLDNHSSCNTFIDVQNNSDACREIPRGAIYGLVMTETSVPVKAVEVSLSGAVRIQENTNRNGLYNFLELEEGDDFTVTPRMDGNDRSGVTTFDLILIRKHILGAKLLDSPYKMIAADANSSGNISVLDLIQLQKLILGIEIDLKDNTSWRFVDAKYQFPDPADPFSGPIPSVININNLDRQYYDADFIGVKIGDVNNSVNPSTLQLSTPRSKQSAVYLDITDQPLTPGTLLEVPVRLLAINQLEGFQFGLAFDQSRVALEAVVPGQLSLKNFGQFATEGLITSSWYRTNQAMDEAKPLFFLRFKVLAAGKTSDLFYLNDRRLTAEAYTRANLHQDLQLRFDEQDANKDEFRFLQNWPNPADLETTLTWLLPKGTKGRLKVIDNTGRVVWQEEGAFEAGWNRYRLSTANFPSGVLYYRFESDAYQASGKMLVIHR